MKIQVSLQKMMKQIGMIFWRVFPVYGSIPVEEPNWILDSFQLVTARFSDVTDDFSVSKKVQKQARTSQLSHKVLNS